MRISRISVIALIAQALVICQGYAFASGREMAAKRAIDEILARPQYAGAVKSCLVKTLDTGVTVYEKDSGILLMPASNLKLVTSAAALDYLGPGYRFTTRILASAPLDKDGVLNGDLIIQGSCDPMLDSAGLEAMIQQAKKNGLKRVNGDVIADPGPFERASYGPGWAWDYLSDYFAAPCGGLNYRHNVVTVRFKPGARAGMDVKMSLEPDTGAVRAVTSIVTAPAGSRMDISRERDAVSGVFRYYGSIPIDVKNGEALDSISVSDPSLFTASALRDILVSQDIPVSGSARSGAADKGCIMLAQGVSEPLSILLSRLNKWSDNLIAESLIRAMGGAEKKEATLSNGRQVVLEFCKKAGMDVDGIALVDGSGLSRLNLLTTDNIVRLLVHMNRHPFSQYYKDSLPVAGVDGNLATRLKGTPAEKNVRAKTGYLGHVSSLSGYLTTKAGQPLVFSIIFNNYNCRPSEVRDAEDEICGYLAGVIERF